MKPKHTPVVREYLIAVPVKETWFFTVEATSKEEALRLYLSRDDSVHQVYSDGGWPHGSKTKVIE